MLYLECLYYKEAYEAIENIFLLTVLVLWYIYRNNDTKIQEIMLH